MKILAALLLCIPLAAKAADKPVSSKYIDFTGGLNDFTASIYLKPNESPNLLNVVIDEPNGQLSQRNGYALCGHSPSGKTVTNLFAHTKTDGSRFLIVTDNETVWQTDDCQSFDTIWTGLSADSRPRFATIRNNLWIVNGSTYPIVWTGETATMLDGSGTKPLGPKAKYISFWRNRVFLANTTADPSGVFFSAVTNSNGQALDPAVSSEAWSNTNNLIYFSRDDGNPIYGIKLYRDNIYVFKGTSGILRLVFNDENAIGGINITKTVSNIGSKFQDSIVEMDDGLLRFVGLDGVYLFDGNQVKRISTKWNNTFYGIIQPGMGEAYATWDSGTDFSAGTLVDLSTGTQGYENALAFHYKDFDNWSLESSSAQTAGYNQVTREEKYTTNWTISGVKADPVYMGTSIYYGTKIIDKDNVDYGSAVTSVVSGGEMMVTMDTCYYNLVAGGRSGFTVYVFDLNGSVVKSQGFNSAVQNAYQTGVSYSLDLTGITGPVKVRFTEFNDWRNYVESAYFPAEVLPGHKLIFGYGIGIDYTTCNGALTGTLKTRLDLPFISSETPKSFYPTSGTWESPNTQAAGLTQWKLFDAVSSANGKTLTFQVKTNTAEAYLSTTPYVTIIPGVKVSDTTDGWVKIKVTESSDNNYTSPKVERLGVNWVTGAQSKSTIVSTNYQSRYWMASATSTVSDYNSMTMVESKSPLGTYTKYDLPITALTVWNNRLYGGIGDTDYIVQLDTTSTDNGKTITSYWDSKDEIYDSPVYFKSINKMVIDYLNTPDNSTLRIGLSNDMGKTYSYKTMDTGLASLIRNTRIINMDANRTLQFRSRVINTTPGVGFRILGINTFGTQSDFTGN